MTTSDYRISVLEDHIFVERAAGARVVAAEQAVMIHDIMDTCRQSGCKNVLLTGARVKIDMSTLDLLQLGNEVANSRLRIAVVEEHDASAEDTSFLENVAWNRGGLIRFFDNLDAARRWLGIT